MLILASGSPRRKEILTMLGYSFLVDPADVDESLPEGIAPHDAVAELSRRKALETAARRPDDVVIGSDTVVSVAGEILGKPRDREDAARMLRLLSGKTHQVYTGVTLAGRGDVQTVVAEADVTFLPMTEEQIQAYLTTGEPFDKAGAYAVQGRGSAYIRSISGDFFAIMGLPSSQTVRLLERFGLRPDEGDKQ